jgi:hypothetical protein
MHDTLLKVLLGIYLAICIVGTVGIQKLMGSYGSEKTPPVVHDAMSTSLFLILIWFSYALIMVFSLGVRLDKSADAMEAFNGFVSHPTSWTNSLLGRIVVVQFAFLFFKMIVHLVDIIDSRTSKTPIFGLVHFGYNNDQYRRNLSSKTFLSSANNVVTYNTIYFLLATVIAGMTLMVSNDVSFPVGQNSIIKGMFGIVTAFYLIRMLIILVS